METTETTDIEGQLIHIDEILDLAKNDLAHQRITWCRDRLKEALKVIKEIGFE